MVYTDRRGKASDAEDEAQDSVRKDPASADHASEGIFRPCQERKISFPKKVDNMARVSQVPRHSKRKKGVRSTVKETDDES